MSQSNPVITRIRVTKKNCISIHNHDAIVIHHIRRLHSARKRLENALDAFHTRWGIDWTEYNTRTRKRRR